MKSRDPDLGGADVYAEGLLDLINDCAMDRGQRREAARWLHKLWWTDLSDAEKALAEQRIKELEADHDGDTGLPELHDAVMEGNW